jgi:hypothetical protein
VSQSYYRAVAKLRLDRPVGLGELESLFAAGSAPTTLDGPLDGRLLAFTVGHGLDRLFEMIADAWMPWKGKVFDAAARRGRNLFTSAVRPMLRMTIPAHPVLGAGPGRCTAFPFLTSVGGSAVLPGVEVLRIDYRDVPENPRWPVRRTLDELVDIGDGRYLGQALLEWHGRLRRAAWFELTSPAHAAAQQPDA